MSCSIIKNFARNVQLFFLAYGLIVFLVLMLRPNTTLFNEAWSFELHYYAYVLVAAVVVLLSALEKNALITNVIYFGIATSLVPAFINARIGGVHEHNAMTLEHGIAGAVWHISWLVIIYISTLAEAKNH